MQHHCDNFLFHLTDKKNKFEEINAVSKRAKFQGYQYTSWVFTNANLFHLTTKEVKSALHWQYFK